MQLFRSEEDVQAWADGRGLPVGSVFSLEVLWRLASAWYDDRLDEGWTRKSAEERQAILFQVGLRGPFWRVE